MFLSSIWFSFFRIFRFPHDRLFIKKIRHRCGQTYTCFFATVIYYHKIRPVASISLDFRHQISIRCSAFLSVYGKQQKRTRAYGTDPCFHFIFPALQDPSSAFRRCLSYRTLLTQRSCLYVQSDHSTIPTSGEDAWIMPPVPL